MVHGRTGTRPLDDPAYDDLFATAARSHQPVFIHPHMDAGLSALRLILRGTFDRHPGLQLVLGHWGEMLLFWMDRADSLSGTGAGQVLFSTDYPFYQPGRAAVGQFCDAIPDPADRSKIASGNAEALFHLTW